MRDHSVLIWGTVGSALLLILFLFLQVYATTILQLPTQWLWVSLVPVLLCLIAGGYIGKVKIGDLEAGLPDKRLKSLPEAGSTAIAERTTPTDWQEMRNAEYKRTSGLCLVHVYIESKHQEQFFDAFIYLVRHEKGSIHPQNTGLADVAKVEFYLGSSWNHQVFTVANNGNNILGIRAHAFGTYLATCRVTFTKQEEEPVVLHRYIDCEMLTGKT